MSEDILFGKAYLSVNGVEKQRGQRRSTAHVMLHGVEHKSCARCASLLPLDQFAHDKHSLDGLFSRCKKCDNQNRRERHHSRSAA